LPRRICSRRPSQRSRAPPRSHVYVTPRNALYEIAKDFSRKPASGSTPSSRLICTRRWSVSNQRHGDPKTEPRGASRRTRFRLGRPRRRLGTRLCGSCSLRRRAWRRPRAEGARRQRRLPPGWMGVEPAPWRSQHGTAGAPRRSRLRLGHAAVRIDVEIARRTLPSGLVVSGLVYDTVTGLIEVVVPSGTA
jgi:hypothetical protein